MKDCIGFAAGCRCASCVAGHEAEWLALKRRFEERGFHPDSMGTGVPRGFVFTIGEARRLWIALARAGKGAIT